MTVVEVTCPKHGLIVIPGQDATLHICRNNSSLTFYTFPCPICVQVRKPANLHAAAVLFGANANISYWTVPAEAGEMHQGPPITWDDLIDAHLFLEDASFLAELAA